MQGFEDAVIVMAVLRVSDPRVALRVTEPCPAALTLAENDADEVPCCTVTDAGTVMKSLLETRFSVAPPMGAPAVRSTVQVVVVLGATELGLQTSDDKATGGRGVTLNVAERVSPPPPAIMVALVVAVTVPATALKLADEAFCAIRTEPGTVIAPLLEDKFTENPPLPAGADKVTVQVAVPPLVRSVGEHVSVFSAGTGAGGAGTETVPPVAETLKTVLEVDEAVGDVI